MGASSPKVWPFWKGRAVSLRAEKKESLRVRAGLVLQERGEEEQGGKGEGEDCFFCR